MLADTFLTNKSSIALAGNFDFYTNSQMNFVSAEELGLAVDIVSKLDFSQMDNKLVSFYEWTRESVELMNNYYRKWLVIHVCYPNLETAPNELLDNYWHMHILDTKKYMDDCQTVFGHYLHHYPYFGLNNDAGDLERAFELTNQLFEHHFGHALTGMANPCAATSCR